MIGTPDEVRTRGFNEALADAGLGPAEVLSYPELLRLETGPLEAMINEVDWVRIESPGRDRAVVDVVRAYAGSAWFHAAEYPGLAVQAAQPVTPKGVIDRPRLFSRGLCQAMVRIEHARRAGGDTPFLNAPEGIALACDKPGACAHLAQHGIGIPGPISDADHECRSYDDVRNTMADVGCRRAFIKLSHGSGASGVVAYQFNATHELATTTVALHHGPDGVQLCNTRKIQRYDDSADIRMLLDNLCPMGVYVERWVPKAGVNGRTTDLRVVTIAGEPRHTVLRLSRSPITNLHLLNERADPALLRGQMRPTDWDAVMETSRQVARCFPQMLYLGIDLAVHADLRGHTVFEVNAFGDLLHGVTHRGQSTYAAQLEALEQWGPHHA
ncbi:STM4014 family protein [Phycisphaeraceae bacterium D3-23]